MTQSLEKMAQLCERQKLAEKAAKYWEKYIQIVDQDGMVEEKSTGHTRVGIHRPEPTDPGPSGSVLGPDRTRTVRGSLYKSLYLSKQILSR